LRLPRQLAAEKQRPREAGSANCHSETPRDRKKDRKSRQRNTGDFPQEARKLLGLGGDIAASQENKEKKNRDAESERDHA
jgi:hypothetical protein